MIELCGLTKEYDGFRAVDGLDLTIGTGEFFGLLGPNGAGKTTTIGMLSTVLLPTAGEVRIDGERLDRRTMRKKTKLAVVTQEFSMRMDMTMDEVMEYQGRLYYLPRSVIRERTEQLLQFAGLITHRRRTVRKLSGGMKRKLMVCRALLTEPDVLLLDEPTAGMDAISRRQMWEMLRQINDRDMTIILTTHYIEEAQMLCDRVALLNHGRLQELDSPDGLIRALGIHAVDHQEDGVLKSRFFPTREEAIAFLRTAGEEAVLRATTLEDVFVERAGSSLGAPNGMR